MQANVNNLSYLKKLCESSAWFISELRVIGDWRELVLVQFTVSFIAPLKGIKVSKGTP